MTAITAGNNHQAWDQPLRPVVQTQNVARTKNAQQPADVEQMQSSRQQRRLNRAQALQQQLDSFAIPT